MKIKSKKIRIIPKSNLVEPTDVLVCARVLKELPDERSVDATFLFFKLALLEDGRMLGYADGCDYVLVANLLDEASAGRVRENLSQNPILDLRVCETPAGVANLVKPWGLIAPESLKLDVNALLSKDPDVLMVVRQKFGSRF
jgi:hypothetical protein